MKVFHIISSLSRGGRERQLSTLYKQLKNTEDSIKIICFNKTDVSYIDEYKIDDVIYLNSKNPIKRFQELYTIIKSSDARLLWSWGGFEASFCLLLSLLLNIKHVNGSIRHGIVRINSKQLWRLFVLHLSSNVVANSLAGLKANKLIKGSVWYNGIDDKFFTEIEQIQINEFKGNYNITKEDLVFSSVANLVPYKDYPTVFKAIRQLLDSSISFKYIIVGEGSERSKLEVLIKQLGLNDVIILLGRRTDIHLILGASDIFIHSSRGEGCSNAILEAMANGLPILASDTGGTKEIVEPYYSELFEFQSEEGIVIGVKSVLNKISLDINYRDTIRSYTKSKFDVNSMVLNYKDLIKKFVND